MKMFSRDRQKQNLSKLSIKLKIVCCVGLLVVGFGAKHASADVVVKVVHAITGTKILPDMADIPGVLSDTISITAARGEFEPASFVLRSSNTVLNNVNVAASALQSGANVISASNIDIRAVKAWYQSGTGEWSAWMNIGVGDKTPNLVPELLLHNDGMVVVDRVNKTNSVKLTNGSYYNVSDPTNAAVDSYTFTEFSVRDASSFQPIASLPANDLKQFWLTVKVPKNAKTGVYKGTISITANGSTIKNLNFQVTVPDFDLVDTNIENSIFYRGKLKPNSTEISSEFKNEEQMRAELIDMKNHGIKFPTIYQHQLSPYFAQELAIRRELGMSGGPIYSGGEDIRAYSSIETLEATVPAQLSLIHSYGFTDYYLYGSDEKIGANAFDEQRPKWQRARELGAKIFVAGYDDAFQYVGDILDLLVHASRKQPAYAAQWHSVGHKIYSYYDPQVGGENPQLFRRNFGVVNWAAGYDGSMNYAYQHGFGKVWNDFDDKKYRDHNFTYPTENGVVGTIAWEGYREAYDDNRYLATLEHAIAAGNASVDHRVRSNAQNAQNYLDNLRTTVLSKLGTATLTADFSIDLYAMRAAVIGYIESIGIVAPSSPTALSVR